MTRLLACLWALAGVAFFLEPALAAPHPLLTTAATATVSRNGTVEIVVHCDTLAFALGAPPRTIEDERMLALLNGPRPDLERVLAEGRERFVSQLEIRVGGVPVAPHEISTPTAVQVEAWRRSAPAVLLPVKLEFVARATLPKGSTRLDVKFPEALGDVVLTVQAPGEEPLAALVRPGDRSDEYTFNLNAPLLPGTVPAHVGGATPWVSPAEPASGEPVTPESSRPSPHAEPVAPKVASLSAAMQFVRIGFEHIVPEGLDHILFVLGLFFLSPRLKPLLVQITCFTVAHSVTLALSARGVIMLPASVVEPAIAASIAFVAVENLCTQKVHAWRPIVVFGFGLIHGLGFASAFAETIGTDRVPLGPVLLFNVGVECGQLAVVGIALLTVGRFRKKKWYRPWVSIPASVLIAGMGLFWFVQRVLG